MSEENPTPDAKPISLGSPADEDEPISLVEEGSVGGQRGQLRAFGTAGSALSKKSEFKRSHNVTGQGAVRCRMFHSKISVAALEGMEQQINEWLDGEDIEIKQVGHLVGTMMGKTPEDNVIVLVWY